MGSTNRSDIAAMAARHVQPNGPGFALLIGEKGKIIYRGGFGLADLAAGIPITPEHHFLIGSVTKQFTTMAVLLLQERGLLDYDTKVARFFPSFPPYQDEVTIRHLMTHTAGIKEYLTDSFWGLSEAERRGMNQGILLERIKGYGGLDFAPGTAYSYSNSGYIMLGAIIEQVSGQSYASFITEQILNPLGMKETTVAVSATQPVGHRALGYQQAMDGSFVPAPYDMVTIGWADGNLVSTVDDLFLWHQALSAGQLVSPGTLAEAFRPYILSDGTSTNYGFGWVSNCRRGQSELWHSGGTAGYIARFSRFVDEDMAVIMLTNHHDIRWDEVFGAIVEAALGDRLDPLVDLELPEKELRDKEGCYGSPDGRITIGYDAGQRKLTCTVETRRLSGEYTLSPRSEIHFGIDTPADYQVKFSGDNGVERLELDCNGRLIAFAKIDEQPSQR